MCVEEERFGTRMWTRGIFTTRFFTTECSGNRTWREAGESVWKAAISSAVEIGFVAEGVGWLEREGVCAVRGEVGEGVCRGRVEVRGV